MPGTWTRFERAVGLVALLLALSAPLVSVVWEALDLRARVSLACRLSGAEGDGDWDPWGRWAFSANWDVPLHEIHAGRAEYLRSNAEDFRAWAFENPGDDDAASTLEWAERSERAAASEDENSHRLKESLGPRYHADPAFKPEYASGLDESGVGYSLGPNGLNELGWGDDVVLLSPWSARMALYGIAPRLLLLLGALLGVVLLLVHFGPAPGTRPTLSYPTGVLVGGLASMLAFWALGPLSEHRDPMAELAVLSGLGLCVAISSAIPLWGLRRWGADYPASVALATTAALLALPGRPFSVTGTPLGVFVALAGAVLGVGVLSGAILWGIQRWRRINLLPLVMFVSVVVLSGVAAVVVIRDRSLLVPFVWRIMELRMGIEWLLEEMFQLELRYSSGRDALAEWLGLPLGLFAASWWGCVRLWLARSPSDELAGSQPKASRAWLPLERKLVVAGLVFLLSGPLISLVWEALDERARVTQACERGGEWDLDPWGRPAFSLGGGSTTLSLPEIHKKKADALQWKAAQAADRLSQERWEALAELEEATARRLIELRAQPGTTLEFRHYVMGSPYAYSYGANGEDELGWGDDVQLLRSKSLRFQLYQTLGRLFPLFAGGLLGLLLLVHYGPARDRRVKRDLLYPSLVAGVLSSWLLTVPLRPFLSVREPFAGYALWWGLGLGAAALTALLAWRLSRLRGVNSLAWCCALFVVGLGAVWVSQGQGDIDTVLHWLIGDILGLEKFALGSSWLTRWVGVPASLYAACWICVVLLWLQHPLPAGGPEDQPG